MVRTTRFELVTAGTANPYLTTNNRDFQGAVLLSWLHQLVTITLQLLRITNGVLR